MNVFYENFGLRPFQVEKNKIIYGEKIEGGKHIIMTVYQAFSGIDVVLYNSFEKYARKPGEIQTSSQDFYCISYYISGVYESEIRKNRQRYAMPGSINIIKSYNSHSKAEIKSDTMQGFSIMLFPEYFSTEEVQLYMRAFGVDIFAVIDYMNKIADSASIIPDIKLLHIAYELLEYLMDENIGMVRMKSLEFFCSIVNDGFKCISSDKNFSKEQIEKTKIIQEKMLYDLSKHYTIRELCQEKRLSETIFKECFKAIYQQTPYNFLRMAKMNKAAELLRGKKITVAEVARELGYENPSNFTRTFKAMFGVLPKAYKENN